MKVNPVSNHNQTYDPNTKIIKNKHKLMRKPVEEDIAFFAKISEQLEYLPMDIPKSKNVKPKTLTETIDNHQDTLKEPHVLDVCEVVKLFNAELKMDLIF